MKKRNEEITFKDILGIFLPKIWIIAIVSVLFSVLFGWYTNVSTKDTYTTQTVFKLRSASSAPTTNNIEYIDSVLATFKYKLRGDDFFAPVVTDVNEYYPGSYTWVSSPYVSAAVSYSPLGEGLLLISVTTEDPRLSYAISQSLLNVVPKNLIEENQGLFSIEIYDKPDIAPGVNPKPVTKNAVVGFAIGAVLSAAAVWIFSALDVVVRNKKKIEDFFDIPVLAVIPAKKSFKEGSENEVV